MISLSAQARRHTHTHTHTHTHSLSLLLCLHTSCALPPHILTVTLGPMGSHLHVEQNSLLLFTSQMLLVDMMTLAALITLDWAAARGHNPTATECFIKKVQAWLLHRKQTRINHVFWLVLIFISLVSVWETNTRCWNEDEAVSRYWAQQLFDLCF